MTLAAANLQAAIEAFARLQVGLPYDYRGISGFLTRRDSANPTKWFCSELVSAAFSAAGVPLLRLEPHKIAPGDLAASPLLNQIALLYTNPKSRTETVAGEGIRIGLYRGRSLVSRAIRFRTWSDYSHASIILPDDWVIEALPSNGVALHHSIHDLHTPETPVEIWQPNWTALISAWSPSQTERTEP